jgi:hypothetical protein
MKRRIQRPAVKKKPWGDRTWESTAQPTTPSDPATQAAALAAAGYYAFRVGVLPTDGGGFRAYINPRFDTDPGYCDHTATARTREAAKRLAIQEHKERCVTR